MPRRLLGVFMLLLVSSSVVWAQGDAVLMQVGTERITCREFEYYFNNSQEKRVDAFMETYGRFKQKVQRAKELALDTLPSYREQMEAYRRMIEQRKEIQGRKNGSQCEEKEWIRLMHITYPLKQSASKRDLMEGNRYMDSLYATLKENPEVQPMEILPWKQTRYLLNEWKKQLDGLPKGEISKPFVSPLGVHMIGWKEKRMGKPSGNKMQRVDEALAQKEMEEALLVAVLEDFWESKLECTEKELEEHFKKFRSNYGYGTPHFKGMVIHCRDKKEAKAIKKYLKKYPEKLWQTAIERMPKDVSNGCRVESGLFAIGTNPYVDKLVFKCGDFSPLADYPYTWVLGKSLKKGPDDFRLFRAKVENDCRELKKKVETDAFARKYKVEINKEVLKTVNRAENK